MKKFFLIISLLSAFFVNDAVGACSGSGLTWSCSAGSTAAEVASVIASATSGATINFEAGSYSWSNTINITSKTINFIGAGIGNSAVTNNSGSNIFSFRPSSSSISMRVSGFTFNCNGNICVGLYNDTNYPTTKVRIDHNRFYNSGSSQAVYGEGVWGLIDHNNFDNIGYPLRIGFGRIGSWGTWQWTTYGVLVWGNENSMYVENNTFTGVATAVCDQDYGGRYVFRYNSISSAGARYPWFDIHEGGGSYRAGMGGEIYGNTFNQGGRMVDHRGGRLAMHHNQGVSSTSYYTHEVRGCPQEEKEKVNSSYIFLNRIGATGSFIEWSQGATTCTDAGFQEENIAFWMSKNSPPFTGSVGVGAGTLAARPTTCTTGVGYWATNQSITNLTGMVGVDPATPVSGTLYKCTATNTWTAFYTPYTFPHPLTTGGLPPPPLKEPNPPGVIQVN